MEAQWLKRLANQQQGHGGASLPIPEAHPPFNVHILYASRSFASSCPLRILLSARRKGQQLLHASHGWPQPELDSKKAAQSTPSSPTSANMDATKDVMAFQYSDFAAGDDADSDSDCFDSSIKENTGRWTGVEHRLFLEGLEQHGKQWKKIAAMIKTRTVVQIRTHAQKYFQKLAKAKQSGFEGEILMDGRSSFATTSKRTRNRRKSSGSRDHSGHATSSAAHHRASIEQDDSDEESNSTEEHAARLASNNSLSIDARAPTKIAEFPGTPSPTSVADLEIPLGVDLLQMSRSKPVTRQRSAIAAATVMTAPDVPRHRMPAPAQVQASALPAVPRVVIDSPVDDHARSSEQDLLLEQDALSWLVEAEDPSLTLDGSTDVDTTSSSRDGSSVDADDFATRAQQHSMMPMQNQRCSEAQMLHDSFQADLHSQVPVLTSVPQAASLDVCPNKRMRMSSNLFCAAPLVVEQPQSFTLELTNDASPYCLMQHTTMNSQLPRKNTTPRALEYNHHMNSRSMHPSHQQLHHHHHHQQQQQHQHRHHMHHVPLHHPTSSSVGFFHDEPFCTESDAFRVSLDVDTFLSGFSDVLSA